MLRNIVWASIVLVAAAVMPDSGWAQPITFSGYSMQTNGSAQLVGTTLRVVPAVVDQAGSAFITTPFALSASTDLAAFFEFQISGSSSGADGFTFTLQNSLEGLNALGGVAGDLGYFGITPSVAVEFDTYVGGSVGNPGDPFGDHPGPPFFVGINIDSVPGGPGSNAEVPNLRNQPLFAWIDYNASTKQFSVFFSDTNSKPAAPLLTQTIDLVAILGNQTYIGFTAGTGNLSDNHDILALTVQGQEFTLSSFPLKDTTGHFLTPYNSEIISIFDHSMEDGPNSGVVGLYKCNGKVVAFTDDVGQFGSFGAFAGDTNCKDALGYGQKPPRSFTFDNIVNYKGAAKLGESLYLNYDGHPGFDYRADLVDPVKGVGTPVFAATDGRIFYPLEAVGMWDPTDPNRAYCFFHTLAEIPDDAAAYRVYYLHLSTHPASLSPRATPRCDRSQGDTEGKQNVPFKPQQGCAYIDPSSGKSVPLFLPLPAGTHVMAGCEIARSGDAGTEGKPSHPLRGSAHLHFEVQQIFPTGQVRLAAQTKPAQIELLECFADSILNDAPYERDPLHICLPMDPYGWTPTVANCPDPSQCPDPYQSLTGVPSRKLWPN